MNPIGGYFEWEFPKAQRFSLHSKAVFLNSGRHALEYILRGLNNIHRIWIPYFTCDSVLQPIKSLNIPYSFYRINDALEIKELIDLKKGEYLLYTNYYGIKDFYTASLIKQYDEHLIIDNAQALFCPAIASHQLYSPRKYIGMPDGGIAVTTLENYSQNLPISNSFDQCLHLLKRCELNPSEGYKDFQANDVKLDNASLGRMSKISQSILFSADFESIKQRRRENFLMLHQDLRKTNLLEIPNMDTFAVPLVYPYRSTNLNLKKELISKNIFVATYWPNVFEWTKPEDIEYKIAESVVCIPIDQRYGKEEMGLIIKEIQKCC